MYSADKTSISEFNCCKLTGASACWETRENFAGRIGRSSRTPTSMNLINEEFLAQRHWGTAQGNNKVYYVINK